MNEKNDIRLFQRMHLKLLRLKFYHVAKGLLIFFLFTYMVFVILAPLKMLSTLSKVYQIQPEENWYLAEINNKTDSILKSTAFLNSKLLLTENDSICFSLNLADSLITLELQGVTIHRTKITHYKTSRIYSKMSRPLVYKYLSTPFLVEKYESSVVKVPIVVKHAPKDTVEANKIKEVPQLPPEEYVRYSFHFDKPLKIIIEQEEKSAGIRRFNAFTVKTGEKIRFLGYVTSGIFSFRIPEYHPWIKIKIPRDEAKTIFRALPEKAALTLKL